MKGDTNPLSPERLRAAATGLLVSSALVLGSGCRLTNPPSPRVGTAEGTAVPPSTSAEVQAEESPAVPAPAPSETPTDSLLDEQGRLRIPGNIVFKTGSAEIVESDAGTRAVLERLRTVLAEHAAITKLRIEGHTDSDGDEGENMELSGRRALAVKQWLIDHGSDGQKILAVGFGESRPIAKNQSPAGKAQNRRTEFHLAELDGKPYLGQPLLGGPGGQVFE